MRRPPSAARVPRHQHHRDRRSRRGARSALAAGALPAWSQALRVPPSAYARSGGWTVDQDGRRVDLTFTGCRAITPHPRRDGDVTVATLREDRCTWCESLLVDVLTVDGAHPTFRFLGLDGVLRVPVCPRCASTCERTVVRVDGGTSTTELVAPSGDRDRGDIGTFAAADHAEMTSRVFTLDPSPVPECCALAGDETVITVGGLPGWVQGPHVEEYPDCGRPMRHLASVPWNALVDAEGTLYLQLCTGCRVVVGAQQQT